MLINFGSNQENWTRDLRSAVSDSHTCVLDVAVPQFSAEMPEEEVEEKAQNAVTFVRAMYDKVIVSEPETAVLIEGFNPLTMSVFRRLRAENVHVLTPKYECSRGGSQRICGFTHFRSL